MESFDRQVLLKFLIVLGTVLFWPLTGMAQKQPQAASTSEDRLHVGPQADGRVIVPTNQVLTPLGRQISYPGRPADLVLSPDGRILAVLDYESVLTIDVETAKIIDKVKISAASYCGIVFSPDGQHLFASTIPAKRKENRLGAVLQWTVQKEGKLTPGEPISLTRAGEKPDDQKLSTDGVSRFGSGQLCAGLAITPDAKSLYVCLNLANQLAEIDLGSRSLAREIAVGNAPYAIVLVGRKAYVSNFAGRVPADADTTGPAGVGPKVKVDTRNIASEGSVSVVDLDQGKVTREIVVGMHASALAATTDGEYVAVANSNSDTVSLIDVARDEVVETISTRPAENRLFGSTPNALAFSPDGKRLYVANGTNNSVAVIEVAAPKSRLLGCFPTGWYPSCLALDARRGALYVANLKGTGARDEEWKGNRVERDKKVFGYNSHDHLGTISLVPIPSDGELAHHTQSVLANNRASQALSATQAPRQGIAPRVVPERHGEPSLVKHVLYIIKENRTYDQVFGDVKNGEGDPGLCLYGQEVTPNHHKLADEFVLLDNFYCSGVLSADGHQWTDEAYATDYLEKAFGGFPRSYPYDGGDALAYASSGFLWDNVLAHKKTLRVYGEFVAATIRWKDPLRTSRPGFIDCYRDFLEGKQQIDIHPTANIKTIEPYLCPTAIGFPGIVPDVYRAAQFINELKSAEASGSLPNFMIMLLPNDHTSGTRPGMPTPEAAVADNDLALGRIVEAVSHSKFWPNTCIFVVEDDPQGGFDHIDGHRTVALAISPYIRRGAVDSTNYNQTSMVRTIELMLGLPPMNQFDASATSMSAAFGDKPDLAPYQAAENQIPLDRLNPSLSQIRNPRQLHWAKASLEQPLDEIDEADEDTLNRILWFAARGRDDTYPAWAALVDSDDD